MKRPVTFAMFFVALATAACQPPPPTPGVETVMEDYPNRVTRVCDHGRAVYVHDGYREGGVAVVENAPECAK